MMSHQFLMAAIAILLHFSILPTIYSQDVEPISFATLPTCTESSLTIAGYGAEDIMDACLLYDVQDDNMKSSNNVDDKTTEVALVQVTPSNCNNHRKVYNMKFQRVGYFIWYQFDTIWLSLQIMCTNRKL